MGSRFNVPGLFFIDMDDSRRRPGKRGTHISRTNIAGCTTECGIPLMKDTEFTTREPRGLCCRQCEDAIVNIQVTHRGIRA